MPANATPAVTGLKMVKDPETGFLYFNPHALDPNRRGLDKQRRTVFDMELEDSIAFGPTKKVAFLAAYEKSWPNMQVVLDQMDIDRETIKSHMAIDQLFAKAIQRIIDLHVDKVEGSMYKHSRGAKNHMDRFGILRAFRGNQWDPAKKLIIETPGSQRFTPENAKKRMGELGEIIDVEAVEAQYDPKEVESPKVSNPDEQL